MSDEIKEILDYLRNDDYSSVFADEGCDDTPYKLFDETEVKLLLDYITNLEQIRKEHSIMKQFIYENGLWEKLLNDDRFLEHLRGDDNER